VTLNESDRHNKLQQIVSPNPDDAGAWIHQDAWFHLGRFDKDHKEQYRLKKEGNGVYAFILSGSVIINGQPLDARDGLGTWNTAQLDISAASDAELLLMEVPMNIQ
jgi:redox-sensitive bicupin YhaK (pirin superfamily)